VSEFLRSYLTVAIFGGAAIVMAVAMLTMARMLRPTRPMPQKYIAYESGVDPVGVDWVQSQIRYYIFAVLFVIFDVEAVFIFPWAIGLEDYGWFGLGEMAIFIFILTLGLGYAWRKGVLRWV
jgi:NADH-quinone oxidoreductase subunit A